MDNQPIAIKLPFGDRGEAGRLLAARLQAYAKRQNALVLALPRGGVPEGAEIAIALGLPLHVFAVRKLGVPGREELAMGAITSGGRTLINPETVNALHISAREIEMEVEQKLRELARRERLYCRGRGIPELKGKVIILTDDGVATGFQHAVGGAGVADRGRRVPRGGCACSSSRNSLATAPRCQRSCLSGDTGSFLCRWPMVRRLSSSYRPRSLHNPGPLA